MAATRDIPSKNLNGRSAFGDPVSALHFDSEWLDGTGIEGAELAATFASLRIRVGGAAVTKILDHRTKAFRERIYVPLYPLAESLATNWWFFASGPGLGDADNENSPGRHSLIRPRDGFIYPRITAVPSGRAVRLVWKASLPGDRDAAGRIEFTGEGETLVEAGDFRRACSDLIDCVLARLSSLEVEDTLLHREWAAIRDADEEEVEYCRTAAALGWDPYDLDDARREAMETLDALGIIRREAVPAMGSDSPESVIASCAAVTRAFVTAREGAGAFRDLDSIRREMEPADESDAGSAPWRSGYGLARRLRRSLGLDRALLGTTDALARALRQGRETLGAVPSADFGAARLFDGVVSADGGGKASFALRPSIEENRRFALCRALAEALDAPDADAVLTKAPTERQQRNRAFAAEFLAPSKALRERVSSSVLHEDDLADLAASFGVSVFVIGHQVRNHGIARIARDIPGLSTYS